MLKRGKAVVFLPEAAVDLEGLRSDEGRAEDPFHPTKEGWN